MAGNYTCSASSVEGDGISNVVQLRVMYKPMCKPNQKHIYGVGKEENAYVVCEVDSYPPPDTFKWSFNHTSKPIPDARYSARENKRGISILTFSPQTDLDYGTLMCWAINSVGQQTDPCLFHIIPAGVPEPPQNCTVYNQTTDTIEVFCKEGFDGGQSQVFVAEVVDLETDSVLVNITSNKLFFRISRLLPGKLLRMFVYSVNVRGRSDPVKIDTFTLEPAKQTDAQSQLDFGPLLSGIAGIVAFCFILSAIVLGALKRKRKGRLRADQDIGGPSKHHFSSLSLNCPDGPIIEEVVKKKPDIIQCNNNTAVYGPGNIIPALSPSNADCLPKKNEKPLTNGGLIRNVVVNKGCEDLESEGEALRPNFQRTGSRSKEKQRHNLDLQEEAKGGKQPLKDSTVTSIPPLHREVITVRTPLLPTDQESCV